MMLQTLTGATANLIAPIDAIKNCDDVLNVSLSDSLRGRSFILEPKGPDGVSPAKMRSICYWPRRIPFAHKIRQGSAVITPVTDWSPLVATSVFGADRIRHKDSETRSTWEFLLLRLLDGQNRAKLQAKYWVDKDVPAWTPRGNDSFPLEPYQRVASACALGTAGYALFMEQGTGKTAVTIARLDSERNVAKRPLFGVVICPKSVQENWRFELAKFSTKRVFSTVLRGDPIARTKKIIEAYGAAKSGSYDYSVAICAYDAYTMSQKQVTALPLDFAVLDESQAIKNQNTNRWKAVELLRENAPIRMLLTGTPIANTVVDLYTQLEFLGETWSGFASMEDFKKFHARLETGYNDQGKAIERITGMQNVPLLQERLARCSFICKKEQVLPDLPKKQYAVREVEMSPPQKKAYKALATQLMAEIDEALTNTKNASVTARHALVKMLRLSQITSGFLVLDEVENDDFNAPLADRELVDFEPNPKLVGLTELLGEELGDRSKAIIWAHYRKDIENIYRTLSDRYECVTFYGGTSDAQRANALEAFNKGSARVWISNAGSGGAGLNLLGMSGGDWFADTTIYFSQDWSAIKRSQSEARNHRRGTPRPVKYYDLVVPDSIDTEIREAVVNKQRNAEQVQNVRGVLERLSKCV